MGALISKSKTTLTRTEQLENLDKEIKDLMDFQAKNQRLQRLWVGRLLVYSSVFYLLISLFFYCVYLPQHWLQRFTMALPFFAYPVLVWFIRKLFIFLFSRRTELNNDKLEELKTSKRKLLEEVMETETYKNAKQILERFDPEAIKKHESQSTPRQAPGADLRQRGVAMRPMPMGPLPLTPRPVPGGTPVAPGGPPERSPCVIQGPQPGPLLSPRPGGLPPSGPMLARPILPQERGAVDRVIEYLVGDGPQNRYALICKQCFSHNGMALKEEFEYLAFHCAYCYFLNPARRTRPLAPRLPEFSYERILRADGSSPAAEGSSLAGEGSSLAEESSSPAGEGSSPTGEGSSLAGEGSSLAGEGSSPAAEDSSLAGEGSLLATEDSSLAGESSSMVVEGSSLAGEGSSLAGEEAAGESSVAAEESSLAAERPPLAVEDPSLAVEEPSLTLSGDKQTLHLQ